MPQTNNEDQNSNMKFRIQEYAIQSNSTKNLTPINKQNLNTNIDEQIQANLDQRQFAQLHRDDQINSVEKDNSQLKSEQNNFKILQIKDENFDETGFKNPNNFLVKTTFKDNQKNNQYLQNTKNEPELVTKNNNDPSNHNNNIIYDQIKKNLNLNLINDSKTPNKNVNLNQNEILDESVRQSIQQDHSPQIYYQNQQRLKKHQKINELIEEINTLDSVVKSRKSFDDYADFMKILRQSTQNGSFNNFSSFQNYGNNINQFGKNQGVDQNPQQQQQEQINKIDLNHNQIAQQKYKDEDIEINNQQTLQQQNNISDIFNNEKLQEFMQEISKKLGESQQNQQIQMKKSFQEIKEDLKQEILEQYQQILQQQLQQSLQFQQLNQNQNQCQQQLDQQDQSQDKNESSHHQKNNLQEQNQFNGQKSNYNNTEHFQNSNNSSMQKQIQDNNKDLQIIQQPQINNQNDSDIKENIDPNISLYQSTQKSKNSFQSQSSVRGNQPAHKENMIFYYEVKIVGMSQGENQDIVIGIGPEKYPQNKQPGQSLKHGLSYGYKCNGNIIYQMKEESQNFEPFGQGDIIGCGINFLKKQLFWTKNGNLVGSLPDQLDSFSLQDYYCLAGVHYFGDKLSFNFGKEDFKLKDEKKKAKLEIKQKLKIQEQNKKNEKQEESKQQEQNNDIEFQEEYIENQSANEDEKFKIKFEQFEKKYNKIQTQDEKNKQDLSINNQQQQINESNMEIEINNHKQIQQHIDINQDLYEKTKQEYQNNKEQNISNDYTLLQAEIEKQIRQQKEKSDYQDQQSEQNQKQDQQQKQTQQLSLFLENQNNLNKNINNNKISDEIIQNNYLNESQSLHVQQNKQQQQKNQQEIQLQKDEKNLNQDQISSCSSSSTSLSSDSSNSSTLSFANQINQFSSNSQDQLLNTQISLDKNQTDICGLNILQDKTENGLNTIKNQQYVQSKNELLQQQDNKIQGQNTDENDVKLKYQLEKLEYLKNSKEKINLKQQKKYLQSQLLEQFGLDILKSSQNDNNSKQCQFKHLKQILDTYYQQINKINLQLLLEQQKSHNITDLIH
ncbi:Concanavalin A-like lectin/glucanases superfamily [Pseudocohnilembus persalinus]|uniref:Concanavalin A-like lectin/glucanases superfamily n=1 Tax=Pseudocohnilembus persalinus TaxID=266149 RepID=A0A0V0QSI1_PSEPJ|nr:Concanavalin A-like lectin/glucanases superfamily [Pseudocohnilembus persalinus]|eukprot:KRX04869.1 Concanavalin A-like lectin/glucanases superfamily [Pseudocohnilembus persalinus]